MEETSKNCLFCLEKLKRPPFQRQTDGKLTKVKGSFVSFVDHNYSVPPAEEIPIVFSRDGQDSVVHDHLKVFFILKGILKVNDEVLSELLGQCGGYSEPQNWVNVCSNCGKLVKNVYEDYKQFCKLERRLIMMERELREKIINSSGKDGSGDLISERIRSEVMKVYEESIVNGSSHTPNSGEGRFQLDGGEEYSPPSPASSFVPDSPSKPFEFWDSEEENDDAEQEQPPELTETKNDSNYTHVQKEGEEEEEECCELEAAFTTSTQVADSATQTDRSTNKIVVQEESTCQTSNVNFRRSNPKLTQDSNKDSDLDSEALTAENIMNQIETESLHSGEIEDFQKVCNEIDNERGCEMELEEEMCREADEVQLNLPIALQDPRTVSEQEPEIPAEIGHHVEQEAIENPSNELRIEESEIHAGDESSVINSVINTPICLSSADEEDSQKEMCLPKDTGKQIFIKRNDTATTQDAGISMHHATPCPVSICGLLVLRNSLGEHRRSHNQNPGFNPFKETQVGYQCLSCPATFTDKIAMETHLQLHVPGSKVKICGVTRCGWFVAPEQMLRHRFSLHPNLAARAFTCGKCPAICSSPGELCRHEKLHKLGKGQVCGKCSWLVHNMDYHNKKWHTELEEEPSCSSFSEQRELNPLLGESSDDQNPPHLASLPPTGN